MEQELYQCLEEGMAFSRWIEGYPLAVGWVVHASQVLRDKAHSADVADMVQMRDAAATLRLMAEEGHFPRLAALYYQAYEQACRDLAFYV
jgi:hypothetical protein